MRIAFLFALWLVCTPATSENTRHLLGEGAWAQRPTVPYALDQRIDQAARDYRHEGSIPRVAFFDIAYPANETEFEQMAGYAVMLVSFVCRDARELPPSRIFGVFEEVEHALSEIHSASTVLPSDSLPSNVFGANRWDGLFLFPVYLARDRAEVLVDFAVNRSGFVLGRFNSKDLSKLGYEFSNDRPPIDKPSDDAVLTLIRREFPGFLRGDT